MWSTGTAGALPAALAALKAASATPLKQPRRTVKAQCWLGRWTDPDFRIFCGVLEGGYIHYFVDDAQTKKDPHVASFATQNCALQVSETESADDFALTITSESGATETLVFVDFGELLTMARAVIKATRRLGADHSLLEAALLSADATPASVLSAAGDAALPAGTPRPVSPRHWSNRGEAASPRTPTVSNVGGRSRGVKRDGFLIMQTGSSQEMPKRFWFELQGGFLVWYMDARRDAQNLPASHTEPVSGRVALEDVEIMEQVFHVNDPILTSLMDSAVQATRAAIVAVPGRPASLALSSLPTASGVDWYCAKFTAYSLVKKREEQLVHSADSAEPIVKTKISKVREGVDYFFYLTDQAELSEWLEEIKTMAKLEQRRVAAAAVAEAAAGIKQL